MQLDRDGRMVRYAYFGDTGWIPRQVSLCELFWRLVIRALVLISACAIVAMLLSFWIICFLIRDWFGVALPFIIVGGIAALFGAIAGSVFVAVKASQVEMIAVVKRRFCPLIDLVYDHER